MNNGGKIRVLVVDDSPMIRQLLTQTLRAAPDLEVVGTAADGLEAHAKIALLHPDVLTLDLEMPRMDGLALLKLLQREHPLPVVVVSSLTVRGSKRVLEALAAGAVDVVAKPRGAEELVELARQLHARVRDAAQSRRRGFANSISGTNAPADRSTWDPRQLILVGASTGGTQALRRILAELPAQLPGVCIVQHMPPHAASSFAAALNRICTLEVREAAPGDVVRPGLVLLAPGDRHMTVRWRGGAYQIALNDDSPVHHCRPSVDVLFRSVDASVARHTIAALLTGMGADGAAGMKQLHDAGAHTIAQDEQTSVVYGMPRTAVELGCVTEVRPLPEIAKAICSVAARPRWSRHRLDAAETAP